MLTFNEFLILHSVISKEFLEDFNAIIDEKYIENRNAFVIDSENLRKWLEISSRKDFYITIRRSYVEDIDFKNKHLGKRTGSGGHNEIRYLLTPECTKKICQSTKSKKGDKIRQYFIEIEYVLYQYQAYIIEGLKEKNEALKRNQKPKVNTHKSIIYVFRALNTDNTSLHKLGKTITSKTRFGSHNSPAAGEIEIIFEYETANIDEVEKCVKLLMKPAKYRKYKEIYEVDLDILKKAIRDCDCQIKSYSSALQESLSKKLKGGAVAEEDKTILYMLIPNGKV